MPARKRRTLRLTVDYDAGGARIRDAEVVDFAPVLRDRKPKGQGAAWVELQVEGRRFARRLPDPAIGREVFSRDGTIERLEPEAARSAVIDMPWYDEPGDVVVHGPGEPLRAAVAEIARPPVGAVAKAAPPFPVTTLFGAANPRALTLVFLAEGFRAAELPAYHAVVDAFIAKLRATAPFSTNMDALAAVRVESISPESGIDDGPRKVATLFDGAFANPRRLIVVDQGKAKTMADKAVPGSRPFVGLVVANTTEYGGSGGAVAVFSREATAPDIALHELGHTLFGLADEYSDAGASMTEPDEPNVTRKPRPGAAWTDADRQALKWRPFLTAGIALPTSSNPNCDHVHNVTGPPGVGAFEGGKYRHCQVFRPTADCKMRTLTAPFCPVCQDVIRRKLATFR
jgi:hypothetical protein